MKMIEVCFDILYLLAAISMGLCLLIIGNTSIKKLWGVMALVLGMGDSFHLLPRIIIAFKGNNVKRDNFAGIGKLITSLTMAIFYLMLWHIGLNVYSLSLPLATAAIYLLVLVRFVLCLMPQNNWLAISPPKWTILRNIPFIVQGILTALLYIINANKIAALKFVWLAITLSFACYLPVVFGGNNKKLGALMLPKSVAYLWIVAIGFWL